MIYIDSSVALSHLLLEQRKPPEALWRAELVSSRLFEYEVWNRLHAYRLGHSHRAAATALIDRVELIDLTPIVLARALEPFPVAVKTLDALHLATIEFLRPQVQPLELASYDNRLIDAARALGIATAAI